MQGMLARRRRKRSIANGLDSRKGHASLMVPAVTTSRNLSVTTNLQVPPVAATNFRLHLSLWPGMRAFLCRTLSLHHTCMRECTNQTCIHTYRQTDRQTDRQACFHPGKCIPSYSPLIYCPIIFLLHSGVDKHGLDSPLPLPYSHLDIAGRYGSFLLK